MQTASHPLSCANLRKVLPEAEILGGGNLCVSRCTSRSQEVEPGDLFVAIVGAAGDGHEHIEEAIARGAAAVVVQRPVGPLSVPVCLVPDTRQAFGLLCHALAGNPSSQLKVIGITGTNGKTTTSYLIASVLATAGHPVGLLGTLEYFDGQEACPATHTTPPADQLAHWLARMAANQCTHAVMEVSSHSLDQARVAGITFDAACVTNVRRDHLDYHRTLSGYRLAKSKLFRYLSPEGFAVVNADDPTTAGYLQQLDGPVLTVGIRAAAEMSGALVERYTSEQTFLLTAGSETIPVRTQMIGQHHVYNCLTAAAVGLAYGIDLPTVVRGLEAVKSVPGRLERIECGQPFSVFVDYAHTPDALTACLGALREVVAGRLICVFGAGGDRDQGKRPLMAQAVQDFAHLAVLTSDNPRGESPQAIAADVISGFRGDFAVHQIADRAEAIAWALAEARPGDCVLIAGKGHETVQIVGDRCIAFDDRDVARRWLYQNQPGAETN